MNLSERCIVPELMDDPNVDPVEHHQALVGLRRINFFSATERALARRIQHRFPLQSKFSALDVGSGGGENAAGVYRRLIRIGYQLHYEGWDFSETAVNRANATLKRNDGHSSLAFRQIDAFTALDSIPDQFDVVYCNLFTHHFTNQQVLELLSVLQQRTKKLLIVDDLIRSPFGYYLAVVGCRILTRSHIVHFDGPQSVRAAFRPNEFMQIAEEAGLTNGSITKRWPERFTFEWQRT